MGDSHTIALVAKPTSRIPFVTSEWREHFKMLGCTRGESPCRDSCFVVDIGQIVEACIKQFQAQTPGNRNNERLGKAKRRKMLFLK